MSHAGTARDAALPLLAASDLDAPLAWRAGQPVSARQFLADASAQAELLPAEGPLVNLCGERYRFAVSFAAALLRGQTSLFPPNALPETLDRLRVGAPGVYGLTDDTKLDAGTLPLHFARRELASAVEAAAAMPSRVPAIPADRVAACLLTSGSTGVPQPHAKRWGPLVANIAAEAERVAQVLGRADLAGLTLVATVPAQHSYGFESSVLLAMLGGAAFDGGRPFYPVEVAEALQRVPRPRALVTTPFHLKTLLDAGLSLPATDLVLSATAPLSPQLAQRCERELGGVLLEIYGCTEAGQVATRRTAVGAVWQTFGELRITQQGEGDDERFIVAGGHVVEPTPLADVLQLEDERHFRLLGRANDLIHVGGRRSSLGHLNFHLNSIEGVKDGAIWLPDPVDDAVVRTVAFVVAPGLSAAQIIAALRQRIEPAFVPRRVVHVEALPREATGKLTAQRLREFALEHLA